MAQRKAPQQYDEWGNPITPGGEDPGRKLTPAVKFEQNAYTDEWGNPETVNPPRHSGGKKAPGGKKTAIAAAVAAMAALTVLLVVLLPKGPGGPDPAGSGNVAPQDPKVIVTETPTPVITEPAAQTPTPVVTAGKKATATPTVKAAPKATPTIKAAPKATPTPAPDWLTGSEAWYDSSHRLFYQELTSSEKELFTTLYNGIMEFRPEIMLPFKCTKNTLKRVMYVLSYDCPELFQITGEYTYWGVDEFSIEQVDLTYRQNASTYRTIRSDILKNAGKISNRVGNTTDEYIKEKAIYEFILDRCEYLIRENETHTADGCLYYGKAQCAGYAQGFMLMCRLMGIECIYVKSDTLDHAWNLVRINGQWYNVDITWDDVEANKNIAPGDNLFLGYMNVPDRLVKSHRPDIPGEFASFNYPICSSLQDNYAVREGIYVSGNLKDVKSQINRKLESLYQQGRRSFIVLADTQSYLGNEMEIVNDFCAEHGFMLWKSNEKDMNNTFFICRK